MREARDKMRTLLFILLVGLSAGCVKQSETPAKQTAERPAESQSESQIAWPELPTSGFVSGRVATPEEAKSGIAAFAAYGDVSSTPVNIAIPQYALLKQKDDPAQPVILIQAETIHGASGDVVAYGLRPIQGKNLIVAMPDDVTLLGARKPQ